MRTPYATAVSVLVSLYVKSEDISGLDGNYIAFSLIITVRGYCHLELYEYIESCEPPLCWNDFVFCYYLLTKSMLISS